MSMRDTYDDDEQHLFIAEAAAFLEVHPDTLRRWSDAGKVPHSRTPTKQRRYRVGDLRKLLAAAASANAGEQDQAADDVAEESDRVTAHRPSVPAQRDEPVSATAYEEPAARRGAA